MVQINLPTLNPINWNINISTLPGAHILQTWEWGKVKSEFGWQPHYIYWLRDQGKIEQIINKDLDENKKNHLVAASLVLHRKISIGGFSHPMGIIYIPKGPLLDWTDIDLRNHILQDLVAFAQKHSAFFIKIDPDVEVGIGIPGVNGSIELPLGANLVNELKKNGWHYSDEQIQFRNTVLIDLQASEEELLANMKQKTRYNVNLSIRKGVTVRTGKAGELNMLFKMYAETSIRDGFVIRNEKYYQELWNIYLQNQNKSEKDQPFAEALIAEVDGHPTAGVIIFQYARKAWYLYGMSTETHRDKMPNYLLQWEAIKRAKAAHCRIYDMWGAPDEFVESDPLWGVYRFKEGLGGTVHRYLGAWDLPINRMLYQLYSKTLPGLLDIMRQHGKASTKQVIGA
jgi:lipid II:glycine glycyltransferase (peptidoglycan interpeptide bridge formation enzyme)